MQSSCLHSVIGLSGVDLHASPDLLIDCSLEDGIYIAAAAELFAQAAVLQLPADSPAAAHMNDPQLLPAALELAENASRWMDQVSTPLLFFVQVALPCRA